MATKKTNAKRWSVTVPITGVIYCEVEAESEEAAIDEALAMEHLTDDIDDWETHRYVSKGNVCYAHTREASAEEVS